ncbi:MAG: hypothetical protein ACXVCP_07240 [Bdellovibrio sp.]
MPTIMIFQISTFLRNNKQNIFVAFIFSLTLFQYGAFNPSFNWDIIGYVAAAHYQEGLRGDLLRTSTFNEIKSVVTPEVYTELTTISYYRKTITENSEALSQQMPFYTIRMGYLWTMRLAANIFNLKTAQATYLISSFFAGLCVFLLYLFFKPKNIWLLLAFPIVISVAGFAEMAPLSTPDSMAAFFACLCLFLYLKNYNRTTAIVLAILPLIRTDFVILAGLISICCLFKKEKLQATLFIIPALLVYFIVNKINSNYGYLKIFNFTLIGNTPFPLTMGIKSTYLPYLNAYKAGFKALFNHTHFVVYFLYLLFWIVFIRPLKNQKLNEQVFIVLGFLILHMLLFPAYFPRFFSWCAAISGLQLINWIYETWLDNSLPKFLNFRRLSKSENIDI